MCRGSIDRRSTAGRQYRGGFFTGHWLGAAASGIALATAIIWIWRALHYPLSAGAEGGDCLDFTWIWLSSRFSLSGVLAHAYEYSNFMNARSLLVGPPNCVLQHFDYPPTLAFFIFPLGLLPYSAAFAVWMAATLAVYLAAIYAILPHRVAVIAALTSYPVSVNLRLGHDGFLTAALIGFALAFMERRPWLAGMFLGLLTYKPQFGILFPLALLAARNWRALLGAGATGIILAAAAAVAFGCQTWPAFFDALVDRASSLNGDPRLDFWLLSVFGFLRRLGVSARDAWTLQLTATAIVGAIVCVLWARPLCYALKAAALAAGALLAAPHAFGYDYCILSISVAFLVKDGLRCGFLPGERGIMLTCWAALFLFLRGPFPALICAVLLFLVVRRALRWRGSIVATALPVAEMQRPS